MGTLKLLAIASVPLVLGCEGARPDVTALSSSPATGQAGSADPSLAVDPRGDLLMTWVGDDGSGWRLYFARSSDGGERWSPAVRVTADTGEVKPHGEASPRLVAGPGGRLAVVWPRDVPVPGRQWPASAIRVARSLDGGHTWLAPVTINDDTTAAPVGHNFQGAAWSGDSGLVAAWLDERGGEPLAHHHDRAATAHDSTSEPDATVYVARSPEFGRTWIANQPTWGGACPCCRITLARAADGGVVAAWRQHFPGNIRDIVTAAVSPRPTPPARVHADGWVYPGCPHNGPGISVGPNGRRHVVWYTGEADAVGLYYGAIDAAASPRSAPMALVTGRRLPVVHGAVAALDDGGAVTAFDAWADGARAISVAQVRPGSRSSQPVRVPGSHGGLYPQVASLPGGKALVAYTAGGEQQRELRLARVVPAAP